MWKENTMEDNIKRHARSCMELYFFSRAVEIFIWLFRMKKNYFLIKYFSLFIFNFYLLNCCLDSFKGLEILCSNLWNNLLQHLRIEQASFIIFLIDNKRGMCLEIHM
ncbi:hypothetical protein ACKWTF_001471 [Chironomus riparius]